MIEQPRGELKRSSPILERAYPMRERHPELHDKIPIRAVHDYTLTGALDTTLLARCLAAIVDRQHIMRSAFEQVDDHVFQRLVEPDRDHELIVHDLRRSDSRDESLKRAVRDLYLGPLDVAAGKPFRVGVISIDDTTHRFVSVLDHIAFDGRGQRILMRDLLALYAARLHDPDAEPDRVLGPLPRQYIDWATAAWSALDSGAREILRDRWMRHLDGAPDLVLPERDSTPESFGPATVISAAIPRSLVDRGAPLIEETLGRTVSRRDHLLLEINARPIAFLALLAVWLHRQSGQEDLCITMPLDARPREFARVIGHFVIPSIVRVQIRPNTTLRDLLRQVGGQVVDAPQWRQAPVYAVFKPRPGLWRAAFNYQREEPLPAVPGLTVGKSPGGRYLLQTMTDMDLQLHLVEKVDQSDMIANLVFRTRRFAADQMERVLPEYLAVADQLLASPDRSVG